MIAQMRAEIAALQKALATKDENHKLEILRISQGRKVDAITALTMRRLERDCDFWQSHCARLADALREAARLLPETKRAAGWLALAEAAPERKPTPGKELLAFRPEPLKLSVRDLVRAVEDEMKLPCPEALRIVFEQALGNPGSSGRSGS